MADGDPRDGRDGDRLAGRDLRLVLGRQQAVQLGFLPRLKVLHTSQMEGQIYVPVVNWALCIGVVALTLVFQSANKLGDIYGVAVTGTFILNTLLFVAVARLLWGTSWRKLVPLAALFLTVEVAFFSSNIAKIEHGAWLSLAIGLVVAIVMITWRRGQVIVTRNRSRRRGRSTSSSTRLADIEPALVRVPGVAVFLNPSKDTTPLALRAEVEHTHTLHQKVVIVSVDTVSIPHVEPAERFAVEQARARPLQGVPRHRPDRLSRQAQHPRGAGAVPKAGAARAQPRPRARLLLRLADHDHADHAPGMQTVAQDAVHHDGPQRRQPDRSLRPARRPHRDDGLQVVL